MLKNIKMRMKLALGFGSLIVFMIGLAGYSLFVQSRLSSNIEYLTQTHISIINAIDEIKVSVAILSYDTEKMVAAASSSDIDRLSAAIEEKVPSVRSNIIKLQSFDKEAEIRQPLADLNASFEQWSAVYSQIDSLKKAKKHKEASALFSTKAKDAFAAVSENASRLALVPGAAMDTFYKDAQSIQKSSAIITIIMNIIAIIVGIAFTSVIGENIVRPIKRLVQNINDIAEGDLQKKDLGDHRKDEIGLLFRAFEGFLDRFREQLSEMSQMVMHLFSSSNEISATSAQLGSSASETASAVVQTATTVEEIRQVAKSTKDLARNVTDATVQTVSISKEGLFSLSSMSESINKIKAQMDNIAQSILNLSEQSQSIAEIIAAVDDIAEQSNLLAVNAAIEAAKAGEQGKGFAVVAQEVKSLADQSKQSTRQVRKILSDIQKATSSAIMATEQGNKEVLHGIEESQEVNAAIQSLSDSIANSTQLTQQISYANEQQFTGIEQINLAMSNIKVASSQNADAAKNLEQTVNMIKDLGSRLMAFVERYRL